jgi:hemerythrin
MAFVWRPELATGNAVIDNQHQQLFAAADALFNACQIDRERQEVEKTLAFLADYTSQHFADEEALQATYNYPGYPAHKQAHVAFTERVQGLAAKLSQDGPTDDFISEVYIAIGEWLLSHIRDDDLKMAVYIQGKTQPAQQASAVSCV